MKTGKILVIVGGIALTGVAIGVSSRLVRRYYKNQEEKKRQDEMDEGMKFEAKDPAKAPFIGSKVYAGSGGANLRKTPEVNNTRSFGLSAISSFLSAFDPNNRLYSIKPDKYIGRIVAIETDTSDNAYRWARVHNPKGIGGSQYDYGYVRMDVITIEQN